MNLIHKMVREISQPLIDFGVFTEEEIEEGLDLSDDLAGRP